MRSSSCSNPGWCWSSSRSSGRTVTAGSGPRRSWWSPTTASSGSAASPTSGSTKRPSRGERRPDRDRRRTPASTSNGSGESARSGCSTMMDAHSFDAVVLGREANARYAAGIQRLPLLGSRPFAPSVVLTRAPRSAHLLSGWDYTVPPGTPSANCFGTRWDPEALVPALEAIEGFSAARRVAVDFVSPLWRDRIARLCPRAELVDVTAALRAVRMVKTGDELACIRAAVSVAESALVSTLAAIEPGRRERELLGVFARRTGELGLTVFATEGECAVIDADPTRSVRRIASDREVEHGDLVAASGGVLYAGYEGAVGRTAGGACPGNGAAPRHRRARRPVARSLGSVDARAPARCHRRDPATARTKRTGSSCPRSRSCSRSGSGSKRPSPAARWAKRSMPAGSCARAWCSRCRASCPVIGPVVHGGYFARETVVITDDGPDRLSTLGHTTTWRTTPSRAVADDGRAAAPAGRLLVERRPGVAARRVPHLLLPRMPAEPGAGGRAPGLRPRALVDAGRSRRRGDGLPICERRRRVARRPHPRRGGARTLGRTRPTARGPDRAPGARRARRAVSARSTSSSRRSRPVHRPRASRR